MNIKDFFRVFRLISKGVIMVIDVLSNVSTWSSTCRVSSQLILIVTQAGGTLSKKRQGQNVCESTVITVKEEKCQNCDPKGAFHLKKG